MFILEMFSVPPIQSKVISPSTLKLYKSNLNKLAKEGITTVSELLANQDKVIEIGRTATKKDPNKMRIFLSACFYVLSDMPNEMKVKLYNEFQNYRPEGWQKPTLPEPEQLPPEPKTDTRSSDEKPKKKRVFKVAASETAEPKADTPASDTQQKKKRVFKVAASETAEAKPQPKVVEDKKEEIKREAKPQPKVVEEKKDETKRDALELLKAKLERKIDEANSKKRGASAELTNQLDDELRQMRKALKKVKDELALLPPREIINSPSAPPKDVDLNNLFMKFSDFRKGIYEEKVVYQKTKDTLKTLYIIVGAQARYPFQTAKTGKVLSNFEEKETVDGKPYFQLLGVKKEREGDRLNLYNPSDAERDWLKSGKYPSKASSISGGLVV